MHKIDLKMTWRDNIVLAYDLYGSSKTKEMHRNFILAILTVISMSAVILIPVPEKQESIKDMVEHEIEFIMDQDLHNFDQKVFDQQFS